MNFIPEQKDIFQAIITIIYLVFALIGYYIFKFLKFIFPKAGNILLDSLTTYFRTILENIVDNRIKKRDEKMEKEIKKIKEDIHQIKNFELGKEGSHYLMLQLMEGIYDSIGDKDKFQNILKTHKENEKKQSATNIRVSG